MQYSTAFKFPVKLKTAIWIWNDVHYQIRSTDSSFLLWELCNLANKQIINIIERVKTIYVGGAGYIQYISTLQVDYLLRPFKSCNVFAINGAFLLRIIEELPANICTKNNKSIMLHSALIVITYRELELHPAFLPKL